LFSLTDFIKNNKMLIKSDTGRDYWFDVDGHNFSKYPHPFRRINVPVTRRR